MRLAGIGALYERFARLKARLGGRRLVRCRAQASAARVSRARIGIVTSRARGRVARRADDARGAAGPPLPRDPLSGRGAGRQAPRPRSPRRSASPTRAREVDVLIVCARRRLDRGPVGVQRGSRRARGLRVACCRSSPASATRPISRSAISSPTCARRRPPARPRSSRRTARALRGRRADRGRRWRRAARARVERAQQRARRRCAPARPSRGAPRAAGDADAARSARRLARAFAPVGAATHASVARRARASLALLRAVRCRRPRRLLQLARALERARGDRLERASRVLQRARASSARAAESRSAVLERGYAIVTDARRRRSSTTRASSRSATDVALTFARGSAAATVDDSTRDAD